MITHLKACIEEKDQAIFITNVFDTIKVCFSFAKELLPESEPKDTNEMAESIIKVLENRVLKRLSMYYYFV